MKVYSEMNRCTKFDNGVRIITETLEHYRSVSLGVWVGVGSRNEDERLNGISHFIEHMIFKGTHNRDSLRIAKELDAIGGLSNAFTGKEYTCFHAKVLDKHFPLLADILSDIFICSVFDPTDIDREKQVILQEISMVEDTPDEQIHELFSELFWIDHPLGKSVLGTEKTVDIIDKTAILDHMKTFYTPDRIIIAATGNIEHDFVVKSFSPLFESIKIGGRVAPVDIPYIHSGVLCHYKNLEQVHVCLGGEAPHLLSDQRFSGALLNTILGGNMSSRLFQEIREKRGLAYSIYSFLSTFTDTGLLGIYLATDPQQLNDTLLVINSEIKKIQEGDISETDLKEAKEHLIGGILLGSENSDARMMRLAKNEYVFGKYVSYEELVENLNRVTVDELVRCARGAFKTEGISLVTLGPFKEEDLDLDNLVF